MKIQTGHVRPPIPTRRFDWSAIDADTYDGTPDSPNRNQIGYGETEDEAIEDLKDQLEPNTGSTLLDILRSEAYWTAGIFNSWMEGRGVRAFRNCSIRSVDGKFKSKAEALLAADKAIKNRMLSGVRWDTATPTASFCIPYKTIEKIGDMV